MINQNTGLLSLHPARLCMHSGHTKNNNFVFGVPRKILWCTTYIRICLVPKSVIKPWCLLMTWKISHCRSNRWIVTHRTEHRHTEDEPKIWISFSFNKVAVWVSVCNVCTYQMKDEKASRTEIRCTERQYTYKESSSPFLPTFPFNSDFRFKFKMNEQYCWLLTATLAVILTEISLPFTLHCISTVFRNRFRGSKGKCFDSK